jgi:hypothetical protein
LRIQRRQSRWGNKQRAAIMAFEDLELNAEHVPKFKLAFHIGQIVFSLVLWCMEIAVFRAEGSIVTGNVGWTFAVVRAPCAWAWKVCENADRLHAVLPHDTGLGLSRYGSTIPADQEVG